MDTTNKENHLFNWKLVERLGLYHILRPGSVKSIKGYSIYAILIFFAFVTPTTVVTLTMGSLGLYYLMNDIMALSFNISLILNIVLMCHKAVIVLHYSNKLWKCFEISSLNFLSYRNYNREIFKHWQGRIYHDTSIIFTFYFMPFFLINLTPLILKNVYVTVRQLDGTGERYFLNPLNMFTVASGEKYNNHREMFYCLEFYVEMTYYYFSLVFDVILVMISYAVCCQLETICNAVEVLGHSSEDDLLTINNTTILKEKCDVYDDLKTIIFDHQKIMNVLSDFYTIVKPEMLHRIFAVSSPIIVISFTIVKTFMGGDINDPIMSAQGLAALPMFATQQFITCYVCEILNDHKEAITFALYCSNWTEMEKKSKDLVLLAICINNANNLKVKFTSMKIVNMQFFTSTMQTCYSYCSVLMNLY